MIPGCAATVAACFPADTFEHDRSGELDLYVRRNRPPSEVATPVLPLLHAGAGQHGLETRGVSPQPWGFFIYDGSCCQLHPNAPGQPPAQVLLDCRLAKQSSFTSCIKVTNPHSEPITFTFSIRDRLSEEVLFSTTTSLAPGEAEMRADGIPPLEGRYQLLLQTEMAAGTSSNGWAWAQWLDPRLS